MAAGAGELVTYDLEQYECVAGELSMNRDRLAAISRRLLEERTRIPLFDLAGCCNAIEQAYRDIWQSYLQRGR